jgi:hypothetical protein
MLNPADLDLDDDFAIDAPGSKPAALDGPAVAPAVPAALEPDSVAAQALYEVWSGERIVTIDSPPGAGKPVHVDEPVLMGDGSYRRLGDVAVGDFVISHAGEAREVTAVHKQGVIPTVQITTEAGRIIRAAPDHPFLTPQGWVDAGDLVPGQSLAARSAPPALIQTRTERSDAEFRLAGYLVGDGCVSTGAVEVCSADDNVSEDVERLAESLGWTSRRRYDERTTNTHVVSIHHPDGPVRSGHPRQWLRDIGMAGKTSHTKVVPEFVFLGSNAQIREFLTGYFSTDGEVSNPTGTGRTKPKVSFGSASRELLEGVRSLLLRIGVDSYLRRKDRTLNGRRFENYQLHLRGWENAAKFAEQVEVTHTLRRDRLAAWGVSSQQFTPDLVGDPVVSVVGVDDAECRCLTVDVDHTFIVRDVVVHNTRTIVTIAAHLGQRSPLKVVIGTPTRAQAFATAARLCEQMPAEKVVLAMNRVAQGDAPEGVTVAPSAAPEVGSVQVRTLASCQRKGSAPKCDVFIIDESYQATYALASVATSYADQVLLVGDPGQIGPVVTADTTAWEPLRIAPHRRAPEAFAHIGNPVRMNLDATWRLGQRTAEAIAPLYPFAFRSARPDRHIEGVREIEPLIVPAADTPYDPVVLAQVAEQAAALSEATLVEGDQRTKLRPEDVAVVVSHNAQVSGVHGQLHAIGVEGVEVGTADRLQGGEWHAVVALDPFIGHEGLSPHTLSPGRLCVMASRHATHLSWMHDGKWALAIAEADMPERLAKQSLSVRQRLCA